MEEKRYFSLKRSKSKEYRDELYKLELSLNQFVEDLKNKRDFEIEIKQKEQKLQIKAIELAQYVGIAEVSNGIIHNLRNLISILYMTAQWIQERTRQGAISSSDPKYNKKREAELCD